MNPRSSAMKIALVGIGKIARDQHVPALAASHDWSLAATVSRQGSVDGVQAFDDFGSMLEARPDISTVSLCLPPVPRFSPITRSTVVTWLNRQRRK